MCGAANAETADRHFAPWKQSEAKAILGINLSSLLHCPRYGRDDFPLVCQADGLWIVIKPLGDRDPDEPPSFLFSTASFDWRLDFGGPDLTTFAMAWGDADEGFINCRSWLDFDPFVPQAFLNGICFVAPGNVSAAPINMSMEFRLDLWTPEEADMQRRRFHDLVGAIARGML